ncbi:MAG TPA: hypothetical protein VHZ03_03550 [Trebonia sp.]|jgi:hypothetical protein|nr:hypothetical protein [Trebonia sp.]
MRAPTSPPPRHDGRQETIRYALDSNARAIRLCLIVTVVIGSLSWLQLAVGLLRHLSTLYLTGAGSFPS